MQSQSQNIIVLVLVITPVLLMLSAFIVSLLFFYQKKQIAYENNLNTIKSDFENAILNTQLEIQEQTIQTLSRDIHDNIILSLTLAKLHLNTANTIDQDKTKEKIKSSLDLISTAISDLSNLSRSMNSDLLKEQGLLYALSKEADKIKKLDRFEVNTEILGEPVYMESQKELFIFRIIQEAFNNILKHSNATVIGLELNYKPHQLDISISDNGIGLPEIKLEEYKKIYESAGLINMNKRASLVGGTCKLKSKQGFGTIVIINVPY